jgi:hypothetical protein
MEDDVRRVRDARGDRAAGIEQGARDLLERRQQAQSIRKLVTIPPVFELLDHNCFGLHLCFQAASNVLLQKTVTIATRRFQRCFTRRRVLLLLVVRLSLGASVFSTLRPLDKTRATCATCSASTACDLARTS